MTNCSKWQQTSAAGQREPKRGWGNVQSSEMWGLEGCSSLLQMKMYLLWKKDGFSTSLMNWDTGKALSHQITACRTLLAFGGTFLHPMIFPVSQQISRQVAGHKYLRVGKVNCLRNYHLTLLQQLKFYKVWECSLAPESESTAPHLAAKAQSWQQCRQAAKVILLFCSCWKENSWRESLHEPSFYYYWCNLIIWWEPIMHKQAF